MAGAVQKHLKGADDSVLEAHDGERVFPLNWNIPMQEKRSQKVHATGSATFGRFAATPLNQ